MKAGSTAYAAYWRNSLADADSGRGGFVKAGVKDFHRWPGHGYRDGRVPAALASACFNGESRDAATVEVILRPHVFFARLEHGHVRQNGEPDVVTPLLVHALLARDGRLYPTGFARIPRDLLEPLASGSYAIGTQVALDEFLTTNPIPVVTFDVEPPSDDQERFSRQWDAHAAACRNMLGTVAPGWPQPDDRFIEADYGFLEKKATVNGAARHILALYDHLQAHAPASPLFDRYASDEILAAEPTLPAHSQFAARVSHASDIYPLARAQRDALSHLLACRHGDMLAVNGPPGTGKTTLLLSVVATLWAQAALAGGDPPVVVAASTNNQAVTNIIDAFGKDFATGDGPFAGRWLPDVKSFGVYFPSKSKEAQYKDKYQTRSFLHSIETESYVAAAKAHFLAKAADALPAGCNASLPSIVAALQEKIGREVARLKEIDRVWTELAQARAHLLACLGDDPAVTQAKHRRDHEAMLDHARSSERLRDQFEAFRADESVWYALFNWLPPVRDKRVRRSRVFLRSRWPAGMPHDSWQTLDEMTDAVDALVRRAKAAASTQADLVARGENALETERTQRDAWARQVAGMQPPDMVDPDGFDLADADELADKAIRFPIFLLTTHYWEGRWLLEMGELLPNIENERRKTGVAAVKTRLRRWTKVTPCAVSTFHMLPDLMKGSRYMAGEFVDDYLHDFADLLIVDEAGQVLSEVAGASFALARRALIIGDTQQIEPIWSVGAGIDVGNLIDAGLLKQGDADREFRRLADAGKTASSGSVMRIAQLASRWHYDPDLARGVFLYEHRRCFDEIIGYCNALCYHGKLIPRRGDKESAIADPSVACDRLPALGYLHVDGICQKGPSGSRENRHEATVIAAWLAANRSVLEARYGEPLCKIVGVVTPFSAQVRAIAQACRAVGIDVGAKADEMTAGTVHALQGAERAIILFSSVYSKHADGGFIDARESMLNVAVSRAKNTFIVFGDMDTFELADRRTPRGQLATRLFADPSNALQFEQPPRPDLPHDAGDLVQLVDAAMHDDFLSSLLAAARNEVHIVTPWIRVECVEESGALAAMAAAVQRGVRVFVYTDKESNLTVGTPRQRAEQPQRLRSALGALRAIGATPILVSMVHSKIVIGDDDVYCVGSFNWFSARRDGRGRHETSLLYRGSALHAEIATTLRTLRSKAIEQSAAQV